MTSWTEASNAGSDPRTGRVVLELPHAQAPMVRLCVGRLDATGVWWMPSRNEKDRRVFSCRDAVKARERLGSGENGGVPLWVELKSRLGVVRDAEGASVEYFAAHTRGNTSFDDQKLLVALGYTVEAYSIAAMVAEESAEDSDEHGPPVTATALNSGDDSWFGLVNPFDVDAVISSVAGETIDISEVRQLVDSSLQLDGGVPDTVMTNLGDRSLAFEMRASDVFNAIRSMSPKTIFADIAVPDRVWLGLDGKHLRDYWLQTPPPGGPKIGILTGNAADSGRALWSDIWDALKLIYQYLPDMLAPSVIVNSIPAMGLSMELIEREPEVRSVVLDGARSLLASGCQIITLACNTTIHFAPELRELCREYDDDAELVSIAEACVPAIQHAAAEASTHDVIGLIGIGPVVDLRGGFSGYQQPLESAGLKVIPGQGDELAHRVKSRPESDRFVSEFTRLVQTSFPDGVDAKVVVLALTEVSLVYRRTVAKSAKNRKSERIYVDPLLELGRELAMRYILRGYLESPVCQMAGEDPERIERAIRRRMADQVAYLASSR